MSSPPVHTPPLIQGYTELSQASVDLINVVKRAEQTVLQIVRDLNDDADIDPRWLAIGKTDLEKGFMAICRSIARPNGD
jgi:hypothetical protein